MAASRHHVSLNAKTMANKSGQAMVEFTVIASVAVLILCAVVDFGRALNCMQVMVGLSRDGSNLASRGDTLTQAATGVIAGEAPLDLNDYGEVIVTSVANKNSVNTITGQVTKGGISCTSKIGQGVGTPATVPSSVAAMLQAGQTVYVTEVFYTYQPITPIGNLLNVVMPSRMYEAAYF